MTLDKDAILAHFRSKASDRLAEALFDRFGDAPTGISRDAIGRMFVNLFDGEMTLDNVLDDIGEEMANDGFDLDDDDRAFITHFAEGMTAYSEIVWDEIQTLFGQMG